MNYNVERANKFNLKIIFAIAIILTAQAFLTTGMKYGFPSLVATGVGFLIAYIIHKLKFDIYISGILIPLTPVVSAVIMSHFVGGLAHLFTLYLVSICLAALYFNKKTLTIYTVVMICVLTIVYIVSPESLFGPTDNSWAHYGDRLVQLIAGYIILYFLVKWGNEMIKNIFEVIKKLSAYNQEIVEVDEKLQSVFNLITDVNSGNKETSLAVNEISEAIKHITLGINDLTSKAQEISNMSERNFNIVQSANDKITTGDKLVSESADAMNELRDSVAKVDKISDKIMSIADQINVLSLMGAVNSAGLEYAHDLDDDLGEVADEIKQLADDSMEAAEEVKEIVSEVKQVAKKAIDLMIIEDKQSKSLVNVFAEIKELSSDMIEITKKVNDNTLDQLSDAEEISASAEEISASSEEVSSQTDLLYENTKNLEKIMKDISNFHEGLCEGFQEQTQKSKKQLEEINIKIENEE